MASKSSPSAQVENWLAAFDQALISGDIQSAAAMFGAESYWRDLVSFTWNITTVEGPQGVADLLRATLAPTQPMRWQLEGEAAEDEGLVEGWFSFETDLARGKGHLRLRNGKAFTLADNHGRTKGPRGTEGAQGVRLDLSTALFLAAGIGWRKRRGKRLHLATQSNPIA